MSIDKYIVVLRGIQQLDPDPLDRRVLRRCVPGLLHALVNVAESPLDGSGPAPDASAPIQAVLALWLGGDSPRPSKPPSADSVAANLAWPGFVYPVNEQLQWGHDGAPRLGARVAGVKRMAFVQRRPGVSAPRFAVHWSEVHAPLARLHHPTLVRYTQNVVTAPPSSGAPQVAGIAELQFPSAEDYLHRRYDSEAGERVLRADVARFLAPTGSESVWVGAYPLL